MRKFDETIAKAKEILGETGKAAEVVIKTQKLKLDIASLKSDINKVYAALGRLAYKNAVDGDENAEEAATLVAEISDKNKELEEMEGQLAEQKGSSVCSCGAVNKAESKYCSTCGKEL